MFFFYFFRKSQVKNKLDRFFKSEFTLFLLILKKNILTKFGFKYDEIELVRFYLS
jgi:hypothetical protein